MKARARCPHGYLWFQTCGRCFDAQLERGVYPAETLCGAFERAFPPRLLSGSFGFSLELCGYNFRRQLIVDELSGLER